MEFVLLSQNISATLVFLIITVPIIFLIGWMIYGIFKSIYISIAPIPDDYIYILERKFDYYKKLNHQDKLKFHNKLKYFIRSKHFVPKNNITITTEMKVLISAAAVQLTFGLPNLRFSHFHEIIIFPQKFYNRITKKYHKGEVNMKGVIAFSWEDFLDGYNDPNDGYNLALHEMAHVLRLEDVISNDEYLFLKEKYINQFEKNARSFLSEIKSGQNPVLRRYAAVNKQEFFAVAVESFFEKPREFKAHMPDLYDSMVKLLNQDPCYS